MFRPRRDHVEDLFHSARRRYPGKICPARGKKLAEPGKNTGSINILFTNSRQREPRSVFFRGGLELLYTFRRFAVVSPNSHLTIVSPKLPAADWVVQELGDKLTWIDEEISDERLFDLLLWSDVFALPAAGLHSYSALRALKYGSVLICSDAPGYDELIEHGKTALVVSGRREKYYHYDAETGFMHEDYESMEFPDADIVSNLASCFLTLSEHPELRRRIARVAYAHVSTVHAIEPLAQSVADLLISAGTGVR
jgi:glycosyltransferase involved in cell wall biosynthesis